MNQAVLTDFKVDRQHLVEWVRKWGDVNTDGLLESSTQIYTVPEIEGFIGYKIESQNAVVFGDPVCSEENKPILAQQFQIFCKKQNLGVVYTIVSESYAFWAAENMNGIALEFGKKFVMNPQKNPVKNTGSKAVLVRKKVKHAKKEGAFVKEYKGHNPDIEKSIEEVARSWLEKRTGPQIYLCGVSLFSDSYGKRYIYAEKNKKIVGFLVLNKIEAKEGWLLNNVMMLKDAPKGISELLVISTLEILEKEGCEYVLVGPVPSEALGNILGLKDIGSQIIRWVFKSARFIFNLEGHETFWDKFQPAAEGSYLLFPGKNLGFSSIKALMRAYNVGRG